MLSRLIHRRAAEKAAVLADADRLISRFSDRAYYEARDRVRGRCMDGTNSARHWTNVKREIARRQGRVIGLVGADLRACG